MKNLIFINGTMGSGKTSVCRELKKLIPPSVFLDGDWCWDMEPFIVTDETKEMVTSNISFMLNSFINCSEYKNIIFCWVMHEQKIISKIKDQLNLSNTRFHLFTLTLSKEVLCERLSQDVAAGVRSADVIERSMIRLPLYERMDTIKINVSNISPSCAAEKIKRALNL